MIALVTVLIMVLSCGAIAENTEEPQDGEWQNILLLGGDSRSSDSYTRTDAMVILSVNRSESRFKMTSIMRDTWVSFPGTSKSHKINAANVFGGPELAIRTVNEYFGTDIEDYIMVNMFDLVEIIDLLGGLDMEITESERNYINKHCMDIVKDYSGDTYLESTGMVHLNGLQAMTYTRNRWTGSGDYDRVMRQQTVLLAMEERAQNMDVDELMELTDDVFGHIDTSLSREELKDLTTVGLVVEPEDVVQHRIPVDGTFKDGMHNGYWMIRPDFEENARLLHEFIYEQ